VRTKRRSILRFTLTTLAFLLLLLSGACNFAVDTEVTEEDREQVVNVIKWNLYYAQVEDLAGYMRTIHNDSPARADTHTAMQKIFLDFNLSYYLVHYEIVSISVESADIRVTQDTRKVSGDLPFRDNRLTAVHTLRKTDDGKWKIYYSEMEDVQYLN
jgi:hypothetical protein